MKILALNGSPKKNGNTHAVLELIEKEALSQDVEIEIINIGDKNIHGCIACEYCKRSEEKKCVFKEDILNEVVEKMADADGIIIGSPVYYAGINGTLKSFLDRAFYSNSQRFKYKVGFGFTVSRRSGEVAAFNQINNYFNLAEMIIPPSQYWNVIHGLTPNEVLQDGEGIQTILKSTKSMIWLLKNLEFSKDSINKPEKEKRVVTNFIR